MNGSAKLKVLLVEDDIDVREAVATGLRLAGQDVVEAADGRAALAMIGVDVIGAIVSDIRMPWLDGRQLLQRVTAIDPELPVILMTGHGDIEQAVDAVRSGAYDFLAKPFATDRLADTVSRALDYRRLVVENRQLRAAIDLSRDRWPSPLIGSSAALRSLMAVVQQIGDARIDLLIEGERGTGRRTLADMLHRAGGGRPNTARFIDCAVMNETALDNILPGVAGLAGHPGSGQRASRTANSSMDEATSVILENVDLLAAEFQARLLQHLQHGDADGPNAIAGSVPRRPRIISIAGGSLSGQVETGMFRADLYFHLAPLTLSVPSLRARKQDIPILFAHLADNAAQRFGRPVPPMSDTISAHLANHDWPGNLRELQNFAEQVVLNLEKTEFALTEVDLNLAERVALFEKEALISALRATSGDVQLTCARLGTPRKTLYDKIVRHQIDLPGIRSAARD